MKPFNALSIVLLAASASASPVITVPLTKHHRTGSHLKGAPSANCARAAVIKARQASGPTTVLVTNIAYIWYTTRVGIGSPLTYYNLIIDTGSSNTVVGIKKEYVQMPTSICTDQIVSVEYGSGKIEGFECFDQVTLAANLVIKNQSISNIIYSDGIQGADGILGVGSIENTRGMLLDDTSTMIPTVMNNLLSQGLIEKEILGIYFAPPTSNNDTNSTLTYGGADPSMYEGNLMYTPRTKTSLASCYWGINITSSTYGTHTVIPYSTAGIVDTGTMVILLADDFFNMYLNAIPGAKLHSDPGIIKIPHSSILFMQPLNFMIGDQVFTMDVAAQLIPRAQNAQYGGDPKKVYGVMNKLGRKSGTGCDFTLGVAFLQRYYTVFDTDNNRIGFAQTKNTFTTYHG